MQKKTVRGPCGMPPSETWAGHEVRTRAMKIFKGNRGLKSIKNPVLTLGNFDGVHLGHRKILSSVVRRARELGAPSAVYTFEPHPLKVVSPHSSPPLILGLEDKIRLIGEAGIDNLVFARFTRAFAERHPRDFVEDVLVKTLGVREVWVGHDFSFGKGRQGTVDYLKGLGAELGFAVRMVPAFRRGGAIVSSSRIRRLITEGDVGAAGALLARMHSIRGRVVKGARIGRGMGFPTANLRVGSELVPANGVYAAYAGVGGRRLKAVMNIGTAPTFGGGKRRVEVHILDFKGDIYGKRLEVSFVKRIRDERSFKSGDDLAKRIKKDVDKARAIFMGIEGDKTGRKGGDARG